MPTNPDSRRYLDPAILDKIARLDLRARLVVEGFITGQHHSPYHGFAVEFASHREYVPGDEIKHIDWKVWARQDRFYIKEYEEETNLKCTILLDCSKSMAYGSAEADPRFPKRGMSKFDYAATLSASLAYLLQRQQDAVGLVTFDRQIRANLPPTAHPNQLRLMIHQLEQTKPDDRSDVADVFPRLVQQVRKRGLIALVSDLFLDLPTLIQSLEHFRHSRHEVIVFHLLHDHERTFPFDENTLFRGLEMPVQLLAEPRALRRSYLQALENFLAQVRKACANLGVDYVPLSTSDPLDAALSSYLAFRQRTQRAQGRR